MWEGEALAAAPALGCLRHGTLRRARPFSSLISDLAAGRELLSDLPKTESSYI